MFNCYAFLEITSVRSNFVHILDSFYDVIKTLLESEVSCKNTGIIKTFVVAVMPYVCREVKRVHYY